MIPFSAASTSAAVIPILSASMKSCVDCKNTDRLSLSAFKQAAVAARAKAEKEHAMMAFIQLDAGQSGCGVTYRLTLGLSVPLAGVYGGLTAPTDPRQKATGTSGELLLFRVPPADHRRGSSTNLR